MLKRILVLSLLMHRHLISSEPDVNEKTENTRSTRQLNFGDCCPCPAQDAFQDQDSANSFRRKDAISAKDDENCPCRPTSDSEGMPSIFRPAFRAVEPFVRPVTKKEEPKPLLKPEVGLASSVLETLREVTDQEYQEALVRDAARSALQLMDPELPETESKDVVNIIVTPKDVQNDDIMSEATEMQDSACVLPPSNTNNDFERLRLQTPTNFLQQILSPPKLSSNSILNSNRIDMEGSASETQGRTEPSLKNILWENMKARLDSLKNTWPNTDNRDFITSPNILQKNYLKNNARDRLISQNKALFDVKSKSANNVKEIFAKNVVGNKQMGIEPGYAPGLKKDATLSFSNGANKSKVSVGNNILQSIDCTETVSEPNAPFKDNLEDLDVVPSSSKVIEVKNLDITGNPNVGLQEREADKLLRMDTDTNNISPNTFESVIQQNSFSKGVEEASEVITEDSKVADLQNNDFETDITTEHLENLKDMEFEPSINKGIATKLQDTDRTECISSSEDEGKLRNAYPMTSEDARDQELLSSSSTEKNIVDSKIHTLPNIKADIFRTLENFKKVNEKVQENLRSNVQDALQQIIKNEPRHSPTQTVTEPEGEIRSSSVEQLQNNANTANISDKKSMSTQDLQKMSDSLLELSSLRDIAETSMTSNNKEELVKDVENKPVEIEKEANIDDMITSPSSLNENNDVTNVQNEKLNLNVEDLHMNPKNEKKEEILRSKNSMSKSSEANNEDNEMTAQPSNSVFNTIPQQGLNPSKLGLLQRDFIVQPEDMSRPPYIEGIKDFFNNFRALGADHSTNDDSGLVFVDNQPLFRSNNLKKIDSRKSITKGNTHKVSSDSDLSSYKAKVASPKSLDINSLLPSLPYSDDEVDDVLGFASQHMPHTTNLKNVLRNNFENGLNPIFKTIQTPKMPQDHFSSIAPRLSDSFKSHKNNALKTFRDSLDVAREGPFTINKNNLLGKSLINSDHLLGTVLKTHDDFNDKIQTFHSDLNRRLSSIYSRTSPEGSRLSWFPNRLKNSKNRAELQDIIFSKHNKPPTLKNTLIKNMPSIESNKKKSTDLVPKSNKADIFRANIKEKLDILQNKNKKSSTKGPIAINTPKSKIKIKPLKENKVTISFATTSIRPDTLKSGLKTSHEMDFLKSRSAGISAKLPKLSKSLEDKKKPTPKWKLKSNEQNVLASEISMSRTALPEAVGKSKILQKVFSLEESEISDEPDENINDNSDNRRTTSTTEANKRKTLLLSKLRRPGLIGIPNDSTKKINTQVLSKQNENILDATQSASNNIDTSISATSLIGESFKNNNQSFKCKMVCIQDILDSTDTY